MYIDNTNNNNNNNINTIHLFTDLNADEVAQHSRQYSYNYG